MNLEAGLSLTWSSHLKTVFFIVSPNSSLQSQNSAEIYLIVHFRNIAFFAGSILAVLVVLTVIDEDVLNVEHVFTVATIAGKL